MEEDLLEPASVQYDAWKGTIAADDVDFVQPEAFLGIDRDDYRVLAIDMTVYGGHQTIHAYGVGADQGWAELEAIVNSGEPIRARLLATIDFDRENHADTNPPEPLTMPIVSATEYLGYGFKRLHIRLLTRSLPPGAHLLTSDDE